MWMVGSKSANLVLRIVARGYQQRQYRIWYHVLDVAFFQAIGAGLDKCRGPATLDKRCDTAAPTHTHQHMPCGYPS